jgi:hypothetical protein
MPRLFSPYPSYPASWIRNYMTFIFLIFRSSIIKYQYLYIITSSYSFTINFHVSFASSFHLLLFFLLFIFCLFFFSSPFVHVQYSTSFSYFIPCFLCKSFPSYVFRVNSRAFYLHFYCFAFITVFLIPLYFDFKHCDI